MRLNTIEFLLQEGWDAAVRNGLVTLAAISNVAVALLILGALALTGLNVEHMAAQQAEAAVITVDLANDAEAIEVETALWNNDKVKEVRFVSKEKAVREVAERMGWGLLLTDSGLDDELLGHNPLPDSLRVKTLDPQDIPAVAQEARQIAGVAEVRYAAQVTDKLLTLARGIKISGIVVGVLMAAAMLLVISTTIRLTIYARRHEIRIMQLVGGTTWFIRIPFVLEGILQGLAGAAVAVVVLLPIYSYAQQYMDSNLQFIDLIYSPQMLLLFAAALIICGVVFGAVGSLVSLHRYLRVI